MYLGTWMYVYLPGGILGSNKYTLPQGRDSQIKYWVKKEASFKKVCVLVPQSCLTLCHLMDCSPPGSFAHGILQARILEWIAISSSRGSSWPWDQTQSPALQADFLLSECGSMKEVSRMKLRGTSLAVQWLRLYNAGSWGSIPGRGAKTPHAL